MAHDQPGFPEQHGPELDEQIRIPPWFSPSALPEPGPALCPQRTREAAPGPAGLHGTRGEEDASLRQRPQVRPLHPGKIAETLTCRLPCG